MKTLVVLSALASIAIAAPSFVAKDYNTIPENWPEQVRRDKKSPQGYFYAESAPLTVGVPPVHIESELEGSSPTGRSLGLLKKHHVTPTIIKRPSGYHVYRDSDEERAQADPSEDCSKQVKVKVCNGEKARAIKENDMESSIKVAKEAIEHLQRDLKNIELGPKSASWSERELMHDDIEVARRALDHVHENLDSMSLRSTLDDENMSQKIHDGSHLTHEEKEAQWKEHTGTFKSNEGDKNMEDILKSADQHIENVDTTTLMKNSETNDHLLKEEPSKIITEELKETHERHVNTEINTHIDKKPLETHEMEKTHEMTEKSAEVKVDIPKDLLEEKKIEKENLQAKASDLLTSEKKEMMGVEHHDSHIGEKLRATKEDLQIKVNDLSIDAHHKGSLGSQDLKKIENNEHFRKSNEHEWHQETEKHMLQPKNSFFESQSMQQSESQMNNRHMSQQFQNSHFTEQQKFGNFGTFMKSADHENTKNIIPEHHEESINDKIITPTHLLGEKSAINLESAKDKTESHHTRWAPTANEHVEKHMQMKAATDFHKQHLQSGMTTHMEPTVQESNHMETKTHPFHGHSINEQHHAMNHAKSADEFNGITTSTLKSSMMDHAKSTDFSELLPTLPNAMVDFPGKSAMDMMQWSHKSDGGRSAYGGYGGGLNVGGGISSGISGGLSGGSLSGGSGAGSGAGGAVGVFPNARVGGCAVPLLLSCSPSIVSGSLAKSGYGSGYGSAPAYRSTDEFNFHNKRDTKKFKDLTNKKNIKHRITILDKKQ